MERRDMLKFTLAAAGLAATGAHAAEPCPGDGTPAQFTPRKPADPQPLENELQKYPKCPYCGMDRREYHHSRMLVHYSDDLADGTCSLHCAAVSLSINVDREPKAIYVADNASSAEIKPLVEAEKATFLIGSQIKGVMTKRSKVAYAGGDAAKAAQATHGGEVGDFGKALTAAYLDMAEDVAMIRKRRAERRRKLEGKTGA